MSTVSAINIVVRYQPDLARCAKALLIVLRGTPTGVEVNFPRSDIEGPEKAPGATDKT
jgi:hypothetical protein